MVTSQTFLAALSAVSALVAFGVAGYVHYRTSSPPSRPFAASTFAGGVWGAATVVFPLTANPQLLAVAGSLASIAATWVVVYFFVFVSVYTATDLLGDRHLRALKYAGVGFSLLWALDAAVPVLQTAPRVATVNGITYPVTEPLPLFTAYLGVIYGLVLASLGLLLRFLGDDGNLYRAETSVFVAIVIVGFGANVAFRTGLAPHPGLDITPMSYTVQAALSSYVLFSRDFLDLDRIASEVVVEEIADPVVVLNEQRTVIKANGEAGTVFDRDGGLIGRPRTPCRPSPRRPAGATSTPIRPTRTVRSASSPSPPSRSRTSTTSGKARSLSSGTSPTRNAPANESKNSRSSWTSTAGSSAGSSATTSGRR